jgi:hypothetical protein
VPRAQMRLSHQLPRSVAQRLVSRRRKERFVRY